jgi:hypothetical protein
MKFFKKDGISILGKRYMPGMEITRSVNTFIPKPIHIKPAVSLVNGIAATIEMQIINQLGATQKELRKKSRSNILVFCQFDSIVKKPILNTEIQITLSITSKFQSCLKKRVDK